ncbi:MAG: DUF1549 and DUF1553 domain-containing protein [Planctomycetaceae bacterium]|nr:DUF1549 and DUF1553 domain-containing protein [Planctomycetaceae bacterium]
MHDPSSHRSEPTAAHDVELEQWLRDAYDAPPVPSSLTRRLNRLVADEWGLTAPATETKTSRWQTGWNRGSRWLRAIPMGAALAIAVVLSVLFLRDDSAYAWAAMVEALERHGVVQLEGPDGTRWLALKEGLLGESSKGRVRLYDSRQQVILARVGTEPTIRRHRLTQTAPATDRDRLILAFLLGSQTIPEDSHPKLVQQQWSKQKIDGRDVVQLVTTWQADDDKPIDLTLNLDPQSRLPSTYATEVVHSNTRTERGRSLTYPTIPVAELTQRDFPSTARVVDVDSEALLLAGQSNNLAESSPSGLPRLTSTQPLPVEAFPTPSAINPMLGAAASWPAVAVEARSREEVVAAVNTILETLWKTHQVDPAPPADDEELVRRLYLDLVGRTPTVYEIRTYLDQRSPDRYETLVDRLLTSPDHASQMAAVWRSFLIPEGVDLTAFGGVESFDRWLAERFEKNQSYDQTVRELLQAEGRLSRSGPLLFYTAAKLDPDQLASRTARVFLGMRLECAQCHDHPFEPWTQQDFWSLAAFFAQISRPQTNLQAVTAVMQVRDIQRGEVKLPDTDAVVEPRFLNRAQMEADVATQARRKQLALWLTAAENPYFARATANRVWDLMFGKGIVDPVDNLGTQHPPCSPELLEALASQLIEQKFNLRELFRTVALSQAYRLSSAAPTADEQRLKYFAQMPVKALTAEQVYDCISVATLLDTNGTEAFNVNRFGNADREQFLQLFRTPSGNKTQYQAGIPQALTLMNGTLIDGATGLSSSGLLQSLEAPFFTNRQRIEVLYLATLSRRPRDAEWVQLREIVPEKASGVAMKEGLADILWALLNSAEFTMNH